MNIYFVPKVNQEQCWVYQKQVSRKYLISRTNDLEAHNKRETFLCSKAKAGRSIQIKLDTESRVRQQNQARAPVRDKEPIQFN